MPCCISTINLIIEIITLAEAIFTTIHIDNERFGYLYVILVFTFLPLGEAIAKLIAFCTKTP